MKVKIKRKKKIEKEKNFVDGVKIELVFFFGLNDVYSRGENIYKN